MNHWLLNNLTLEIWRIMFKSFLVTPKSRVFHAEITLEFLRTFQNFEFECEHRIFHDTLAQFNCTWIETPWSSQPLFLEIYREKRCIPAISNLIFYVCLGRFNICPIIICSRHTKLCVAFFHLSKYGHLEPSSILHCPDSRQLPMYLAHIGPYVSQVKHQWCERFKLNRYFVKVSS